MGSPWCPKNVPLRLIAGGVVDIAGIAVHAPMPAMSAPDAFPASDLRLRWGLEAHGLTSDVKRISHNRRNRLSMQAARRSWFDAFILSWNSALRMDISQAMLLRALRGLIAIVLPLVVGVATGYVVVSATIAGGAGLWTVMHMTNPHRARPPLLFLGCVSLAVGAFIPTRCATRQALLTILS